jgi:hypothetical protein
MFIDVHAADRDGKPPRARIYRSDTPAFAADRSRWLLLVIFVVVQGNRPFGKFH